MDMLKRQGGFSIIELMIGISILAFLLLLAMPSYSEFLRNARVRSNAEAALNLLQLARAEALKRNRDVEFAGVDNDPSTIAGSGPTYSGGGGVYHLAVFVSGAPNELIDSKLSSDGHAMYGTGSSGGVQTVVTNPPAAGARVIFNSLGQARELTTNTIWRFQANANTPTCTSAGGSVRCLNVVVTPSGRVRMCDPAVSNVADTRKCGINED